MIDWWVAFLLGAGATIGVTEALKYRHRYRARRTAEREQLVRASRAERFLHVRAVRTRQGRK